MRLFSKWFVEMRKYGLFFVLLVLLGLSILGVTISATAQDSESRTVQVETTPEPEYEVVAVVSAESKILCTYDNGVCRTQRTTEISVPSGATHAKVEVKWIHYGYNEDNESSNALGVQCQDFGSEAQSGAVCGQTDYFEVEGKLAIVSSHNGGDGSGSHIQGYNVTFGKKIDPTSTATATATATPTKTPTASPTATGTPEATPTPLPPPDSTPTATATPLPTVTPTSAPSCGNGDGWLESLGFKDANNNGIYDPGEEQVFGDEWTIRLYNDENVVLELALRHDLQPELRSLTPGTHITSAVLFHPTLGEVDATLRVWVWDKSNVDGLDPYDTYTQEHGFWYSLSDLNKEAELVSHPCDDITLSAGIR